MDLAYYIIGILGLLIVILEIVKRTVAKDRTKGQSLDVGTCMTIGTRDVQEDQIGTMTTEAGTLAVLADGAGKTFGGRIAARIAVETFVEIFKEYNAFNNPQYYFRKAFHCANREILKAVEEESRGNASAGCVMLQKGYLYYATVGNVQISVYREGTLVPVSAGQTVAVLAEQKFREGKLSRQDALKLLENHRLYNYLGKDGFKDIEIFDAPIRLKAKDTIVLMSDGIYDLIGYKEIEEILAKEVDCRQKAFEIIEKVNQDTSEDKDNASIILLNIGNGAL